ncbi:hypothetical protein ACFBZI_09455 [Moraxella sp. ZJ142]|uniref:hypothetical protein n=1 Tax=Moraxella marmotae TaxID=3344520 RepID=UPI0035D49886
MGKLPPDSTVCNNRQANETRKPRRDRWLEVFRRYNAPVLSGLCFVFCVHRQVLKNKTP